MRGFWFLVAVLAGGYALRVYGLDFQPLWRDETDALSYATQDLAAFARQYLSPSQNGPLYLLGLRGWVALAGTSEFGLRYFSVLWSVLTVAFVYRLTAEVLSPGTGGRRTALLAAALAATAPYLIWYAQDAKMYALAGLLSCLIFWLYRRALATGGAGWWAGFAVAITAALLVHFFTVFLVVAAAAIFWALWPATRPRWRPWVITFAAVALPYVVVALWQGPGLLERTTLGFSPTSPPEVLGRQLFSFAFNAQPTLLLAPFLVIVVALLGVAAGELHGKRRAPMLFFWLYLAAPLSAFFVVNARWPLYTERYLIIVAPAFYILLASGLAAVVARSVPVALAAGFLVFVPAGYALGWQATHIIKPDLRAAAARLTAGPPAPRLLFVIPYAEFPFRYYYRGPYARVTVPTPDDPGAALGPELARGPFWLLSMEAELWDPEGRIAAWLEANAIAEERREYVEVTLVRYRAR
jgi:4-amino-4-deoxy-L-arabinose transferase-like glycosyltransferase